MAYIIEEGSGIRRIPFSVDAPGNEHREAGSFMLAAMNPLTPLSQALIKHSAIASVEVDEAV